jgi:hypothetical protein
MKHRSYSLPSAKGMTGRLRGGDALSQKLFKRSLRPEATISSRWRAPGSIGAGFRGVWCGRSSGTSCPVTRDRIPNRFGFARLADIRWTDLLRPFLRLTVHISGCERIHYAISVCSCRRFTLCPSDDAPEPGILGSRDSLPGARNWGKFCHVEPGLCALGGSLPVPRFKPHDQAARYVVIDGYKRIEVLEQLGRDTVEAVVWPICWLTAAGHLRGKVGHTARWPDDSRIGRHRPLTHPDRLAVTFQRNLSECYRCLSRRLRLK